VGSDREREGGDRDRRMTAIVTSSICKYDVDHVSLTGSQLSER
jgi:hypothetical protein